MNVDGWAVMGEGLSREDMDLIEAVTRYCDCPKPKDDAEAQAWRHTCAASELLRDDIAARLAALRHEADEREWGEW